MEGGPGLCELGKWANGKWGNGTFAFHGPFFRFLFLLLCAKGNGQSERVPERARAKSPLRVVFLLVFLLVFSSRVPVCSSSFFFWPQ